MVLEDCELFFIFTIGTTIATTKIIKATGKANHHNFFREDFSFFCTFLGATKVVSDLFNDEISTTLEDVCCFCALSLPTDSL